jgi:ubiquinone/menaquinone biosynthesis C-methylase UbiE
MKTFDRCLAGILLLSTMTVCTAVDVADEARRIAELLGIQAGQVVADLGAGDGDGSVALAEIVGSQGKVFATEVDQSKIEKIERLIERRKIDNIVTVLGSQDSTGLSPQSVDSILIRLVYHHFANPKQMQDDLKRALRPGGRIAIVDFGPENRLSRSNVPGFRDGHGVAADTVIEEMTAAGFRLEERRDSWGDDRDNYLLIFSLPAE